MADQQTEQSHDDSGSNNDQKTQCEPVVKEDKTLIIQGFEVDRRNSLAQRKRKLDDPNNPDLDELTAAKVANLFVEYGAVESSWLSSNSKALDVFGYVTFTEAQDALKARVAAQSNQIKMNDSPLIATLISQDCPFINQLTDGCLLNIFLKLDITDKLHVERVCKRWSRIALQSWSNVKKMTIRNNRSSSELIKCIMRAGQFLKEVKFQVDDPKFLVLAKKYCTNVEKLTITDSHEDECEGLNLNCWEEVLKEFRVLKSFSLEVSAKTLHFDMMAVLPPSVEKISLGAHWRVLDPMHSQDFSRLQNLKELRISYLFFDDDCLRGLGHLHNLTKLDLGECKNYSNIVKEIRNLTKLTSLVIPDSRMTKVALQSVVKKNRGLTTLDISDASNVTDDMLKIISTLPNLENLIMKNIWRVNLLSAKPMPKLKCLDCYGCSDIVPEALMKIVKSSPLLTTLNIKGVQNITADFYNSVISIIQQRGGDTKMKLLADPKVPSGLHIPDSLRIVTGFMEALIESCCY